MCATLGRLSTATDGTGADSAGHVLDLGGFPITPVVARHKKGHHLCPFQHLLGFNTADAGRANQNPGSFQRSNNSIKTMHRTGAAS
tara:strand:+ start:3449 stop:3706 length:258 start_codon:yes stop_codon:yes gene_type:complete